jgi:agmatinase
MNKQHVDLSQFDPNGPGIKGNLFGLPFDPSNANMVLVPVPWEVTVSYGTGTAQGPAAILEASSQVDSFLFAIPDAWKMGVSMLPINPQIKEESDRVRLLASQLIARQEQGEEVLPHDIMLTKVNEACESLHIFIKAQTEKLLAQGKLVGILGGDHSTPLGFLRALTDRYDDFAILQIDAHADLRRAYEGFTYSHASIMYNALQLSAVRKIVQVGIRDLCEEEFLLAQKLANRVSMFEDEKLKHWQLEGKPWSAICNSIVEQLPEHVYISFDIDGLDPKLCPNTGTPVPGGLTYHEAVFLVQHVVKSGRKIIGFDLCEVGVGKTDWDANVGARILYQLCHWTGVSQQRLPFTL